MKHCLPTVIEPYETKTVFRYQKSTLSGVKAIQPLKSQPKAETKYPLKTRKAYGTVVSAFNQKQTANIWLDGKVKPVDCLLVNNRPRTLENNGRKKLDKREYTGIQKQISVYSIEV